MKIKAIKTEKEYGTALSVLVSLFMKTLEWTLLSLMKWRYRSRKSEIMNRKRKLTLEMVRRLNRSLNIPADVLIKAYRIYLKGHCERKDNIIPESTNYQIFKSPDLQIIYPAPPPSAIHTLYQALDLRPWSLCNVPALQSPDHEKE